MNAYVQLGALPGKVALVGLMVGWVAGAGAIDLPLRWRWSNPEPHGGDVVDMAYSVSRALGVQVADRGQIYTSDNLDLWLLRESGTTDGLRAVTFFGSSQRILVTGESGRVLYADEVDQFQNGTLLDGPTDDWLEAVAASPSLAVAVGDYGAVYTSSDGRQWKRQASGCTNWFRGVAFGGGNFVALGTVGGIATSADGTNWTRRSSPVSQHLNRVSYGGGRFTAVGGAGASLVSTNAGTNWFLLSPPSGATNDLENAASGVGARLLVGYHEVRLSEAEGPWSNEVGKTNGPPDWIYYANIAQPGFFLIAGRMGLQSEGYKSAGAPFFWLTPYDSVRTWLWDVLWVSGLYVSVGDFGTVLTSGNGVDWTLEYVPEGVTNTTFLGVGGTTNLLVAVGNGGRVMLSPNNVTNIISTPSGMVTQIVNTVGIVWKTIPSPTGNDLQGVAVLSNQWYVITGDKGLVLTSTNGTNWTVRTTPTLKFLSSVAEWSGNLVATGDDGAVITSTNGVNWTLRTSGTGNWLYRVRFLDNTLLAVGQNGTLLTSTNAIQWTARTTGTTSWLTDAAFVGDTWFVCGYNGTVLTSTNLATWINRGTLTKKALYGLATDSRQLVTVGLDGIVLRCQVMPDLTPITILDFDRTPGGAAPTNYNLYLFGGKPDQQFTLDRNGDVGTNHWTISSDLEILDGSGTLYYLETITGSYQPVQEFYRAPLKP